MSRSGDVLAKLRLVEIISILLWSISVVLVDSGGNQGRGEQWDGENFQTIGY